MQIYSLDLYIVGMTHITYADLFTGPVHSGDDTYNVHIYGNEFTQASVYEFNKEDV